MSAFVDPALKRAIRRSKSEGGLVHAAFTLKNAVGGNLLTPEATGEVVEKLVQTASKKTEKSAKKLVVFRNLQSFSIDAPASLIEELTTQDDISTAALGS